MRQPRQLKLPIKSHGGQRSGAGRPNGRGEVNHMKRPHLNGRTPAHVTVRMERGVCSLRSGKPMRLFLRAVRQARSCGLKVNQFSVQSNHIHLIIESRHMRELSRGMQSFAICLAKNLKSHLNQRGRPVPRRIFKGRYHLTPITSRIQMRNALRYVLTNSNHHGGVSGAGDPYSSVLTFPHLRELGIHPPSPLSDLSSHWENQVRECLEPPGFWLSRVGWRSS